MLFKKATLALMGFFDPATLFIQSWLPLWLLCFLQLKMFLQFLACRFSILWAIGEAEDEWGLHEMKKVITTGGNLRNVIPENFSYFHVEFGLDRGFVHVIDDDSNFSSSFGLNVVRGMLRLPEKDMHRRSQFESFERQKHCLHDHISQTNHDLFFLRQHSLMAFFHDYVGLKLVNIFVGYFGSF